jgi:ATP-binding cassette subfamily B multidrug efflux pump
MGAALRRLLPFLRRYRRGLALGLACALAATAISLASPWILKLAVDDLAAGVTRGKLALYAAVLLGLAGASGVFRFWMRRLVIGISRHVEYDLRNAFFAHLQRLPPAYFHRTRTGDLMSRATNDLSAVRMMIGPAVMYSVTTALTSVVAVTLMVSLSPRLTLLSLAIVPFVTVSVKYFGSAIHARFERIQAQLAELSAVAQEALSGVRVVRAYVQEAAEIERFRAANAEYVARNRALIRLQGLFNPSLSFFLGIGALLVLWLGSREAIAGRLTLGEFVAFNSYLAMLSWPMIAFGWVANLLQRGMASWQRMLAVMDERPEVRDRDDGRPRAWPGDRRLRGAIEVRNLTFAYDGRPVLSDVSFRVEPGRTLAIVGPTGSGKSTLVNLLPRLYEPPPGTVFIDGIDVRELPLAVVRGAIGMVPQEPFLFSDTLAANIAFGVAEPAGFGTLHPPAPVRPPETPDSRPAAAGPRDRGPGLDGPSRRREGAVQAAAAPRDGDPRLLAVVARAAAVARLDKDVADFPNGYETLVGERGITLSGGQKQRTALARAIATDPPILILDDALSAVDTYTEEEILSRLREVMRARTSIIVSHRVSTVRGADLILVLAGGRIVESGRHDDLVAAGGFYAELYRKQLLEEELAAS